ncbi:rCG20335 [Rattus norvegicus]|uniref:RCG20335 n=1 Tax=Rattus norvegicus TaxID=10116 RepID=A6JGI3_RAT|nr:rCG20335 [Rattus norvegicus]
MADSQEQHPWRQRTGISIQHLYLWEANTIRSLRLNHHSTPSCVKEDFFFPFIHLVLPSPHISVHTEGSFLQS